MLPAQYLSHPNRARLRYQMLQFLEDKICFVQSAKCVTVSVQVLRAPVWISVVKANSTWLF